MLFLVAFPISIPLSLLIYFSLFTGQHYGTSPPVLCVLWKTSFNKILRRIWKLPHASHTAVVHCTASLHSLFNQILLQSYKLLCSAEKINVLLPPSEQSSSIPLLSATPPLATTCWWVTNLQKLTRKRMLKLELLFAVSDLDQITVFLFSEILF